jgi:ribosomal protein S18 acetylase RimI-like enzyme
VLSVFSQKVLELAKERDYKKVYVSSYFENMGAIDFYEKNGFSKIDISLERNI